MSTTVSVHEREASCSTRLCTISPKGGERARGLRKLKTLPSSKANKTRKGREAQAKNLTFSKRDVFVNKCFDLKRICLQTFLKTQ